MKSHFACGLFMPFSGGLYVTNQVNVIDKFSRVGMMEGWGYTWGKHF